MVFPDWYGLVLLGLAAFRTWKLIGEDAILDAPRAWTIYWFRSRISPKAAECVSDLLECPWCAGFWIALLWWGAYELWPHGTIIASVPLALSALVGILGHFTSD